MVLAVVIVMVFIMVFIMVIVMVLVVTLRWWLLLLFCVGRGGGEGGE